MSSRKFKIGLIGTGNIARIAHLPAWKSLPDVEVVAVADVMHDRAQTVAREHGIAHAFHDYHELLKMDLDAVDICAPNQVHTPAVLAALEAGKHVLCEKPLAVTTREVRQMGEAADARGLKLMTAQFQRYTTSAVAIKKWIDGGGLGDVYYARARATRRSGLPTPLGFIDKTLSGGGPCMDIGVHALDLCMWLMGFPKPVRVSGVSRTNFAKGYKIPACWGEWDRNAFSVEDFAAGYVHFDNGASLILESSWLGHQVETEDVGAQLFGLNGGVKWPTGEFSTVQNGAFVQGTITNPTPVEKPFASEMRAFIDSIANQSASPVPWTETIKVIAILEGIYASQEQGREVVLS